MNQLGIKDYILKNFNKLKINSVDIILGDVFIALPGKNKHGNSFIQNALNNGASFVITDKVFDRKINKSSIIQVDNVLEFLNLIAIEKRELYKGTVIGITGSIGKTSVKENLKYFLKDSFKVSASIKSYNNFLGVILSLLNMDINSDFSIFEIGTNDFYEIRNLTSLVKPAQVIITNIFPTHLENLINTRNIADEKSDIFNPNYNVNTKLAILPYNNEDEEYIVKKAKKLNLFKILTFGKNIKSNINIFKIIHLDNIYQEIYVKYDNQVFKFQINKIQLPKINNLLICLSIFISNKINLNIFTTLTKDIPLVEGRGLHKNIIFDKKNILLIDESYNASPESMKLAVDFFTELKLKKNQKKFLILGDMKELGLHSHTYHRNLLDYILKKRLKNIIICGEFMQRALNESNNNNFILMLDKNNILQYLKQNVNNYDMLLIKGSNTSITSNIVKELLDKGGFT